MTQQPVEVRHDVGRPQDPRRNDAGASAVEYGLIVFAIAAVIVAVVFALGRVVDATYQSSCDSIANQANNGQTC